MLSCRLNSTFFWKSKAMQANHFTLLSRRKLGFGFPRAHLFLVPLLLQFSSLGAFSKTRILTRGSHPWWALNSHFFLSSQHCETAKNPPLLWSFQTASFCFLFSQLLIPCIHSFIFGKYLKWKYWCSWQPALEEENWIQTSEITLTCSLLRRLFPLRPSSFLSSLPSTHHHHLHRRQYLDSHFCP